MREARIYWTKTSCLEQPELFARALACVPAPRRERVLSLRRAGTRYESLGAGVLLSAALQMEAKRVQTMQIAAKEQQAMHVAAKGQQAMYVAEKEQQDDRLPDLAMLKEYVATLQIGRAEGGKPYLLTEEGARSDLHFSLSHSGQIAMCAVGPAPLGCDVQRVEERNVESVLRCLRESEQEQVRQDPSSFFRIWTLKESYIKMTGEGLARGLSSFEVFLHPKPRIAAEGFDGPVMEYTAQPGYRFACCASAGTLPKTMARLSLEELLINN